VPGSRDALPGIACVITFALSWFDLHCLAWQSFERLEFLGDAVLGLCCRDMLVRRRPDSDEVRGAGCASFPALPSCSLHSSPGGPARAWLGPAPQKHDAHERRQLAVGGSPHAGPVACLARSQGEMTRLNSRLVSGAANARYAAFLGLDRYLALDARSFRCACPARAAPSAWWSTSVVWLPVTCENVTCKNR
jgi:hypothetical protein